MGFRCCKNINGLVTTALRELEWGVWSVALVLLRPSRWRHASPWLYCPQQWNTTIGSLGRVRKAWGSGGLLRPRRRNENFALRRIARQMKTLQRCSVVARIFVIFCSLGPPLRISETVSKCVDRNLFVIASLLWGSEFGNLRRLLNIEAGIYKFQCKFWTSCEELVVVMRTSYWLGEEPGKGVCPCCPRYSHVIVALL